MFRVDTIEGIVGAAVTSLTGYGWMAFFAVSAVVVGPLLIVAVLTGKKANCG